MHSTTAPIQDVLRRPLRVILPAAALLALTYFVPPLNPFKPPHLDLTGPVAIAAYWIAESGGTHGIPWIAVALTTILVTRPGIRGKQRVIEALVIVLALAAFLGGGAYLNEHFIKPAFAVPRPNILELAKTPPDPPTLGMSAEAFYALPDKAARSEHLEKVLTPQIPLHERVRGHWIAETGYSFPSGHSFSSMMVATFFLALGLSYGSGPRRWVFYLLVPWAVAVCFSRPLLRVHSPTDVCIGGLEGIAAGLLAFLVVRGILTALPPAGPLSASTPQS